MIKYLTMSRYFKECCAQGMEIHNEAFHKFYLDRVVGQSNVKTFHIELSRVWADGTFVNEDFNDAVRWQ